MVQEGFRRYMEDDILQFLQVPYTSHFFQGMRIAEHEIAETEIVGHDVAQVHIHLLGVLIHKTCFILADILPVVHLCRLENQRNKRIMLANFGHQFDTGHRIHNSFPRITGIGNDSQDIIPVSIVQVHRFFITTCQHNLWTATHTKRALVFIQGFCRKLLTLLQHKLIQTRQYGRIETDGVLYQENHLHPHLLDVVFQIHLVFYQLDDRDQQIRISQPTEHILEDAQILMFHSGPDTMRERGKHHQWNFRVLLLDGTGNIKSITVVCSWHDNHQIEFRIPQLLPGFFLCRYLRKTWRITQAQIHIFYKDLLIDTAIIFQHECIVRISHQQDIKNSLGHQIYKRSILELVQF